MQNTTRLCGFPECSRQQSARGLCDAHYKQQRKGRTLSVLNRASLNPQTTEQNRFDSYVEKSEGCWTWEGPRNLAGYGLFWDGKKQQMAHRVSYASTNGALLQRETLDHICRNKACVRPDHLRVATAKQNAENLGVRKSSLSGYRGVSWHSRTQKWRARVGHHGTLHHLGYFDDAKEAAEVARQARLQLFTHSDGR